jgi:hypothetical protein
MSGPRASLSLDLDNLWSYMKTHGDPGWQAFPSYLDLVVPRFLELLDEFGIRITVFVVGQDAALERNQASLRSIAEAGHEIGNHSFNHEPWLHLYSPDEIAVEIARAEQAIEAATGRRTIGFRGPGYSLSEDVLRILVKRGYAYDCSTFPTMIGPLARAYYFFNARLSAEGRDRRKLLFGSVTDGLRPNRPYVWDLGAAELAEIPVTTFPFAKVPVHFSYLHWLAGKSETLAWAYFHAARKAFRMSGLSPSLLLHPLDFIGGDDVTELSFFPAMAQSSAVKMRRMRRFLAGLSSEFEVETMADHAARLGVETLRKKRPDFDGSQRVPSGDKTAGVHER